MFAHGIDRWQHKSVEDFIQKLVPKLGNREWRIAFHSYPPGLGEPQFSANDWPMITFGNIGVLAGWLRQHYQDKPHAWEIHLTENGLNGRPEQENAQKEMEFAKLSRIAWERLVSRALFITAIRMLKRKTYFWD